MISAYITAFSIDIVYLLIVIIIDYILKRVNYYF